MPSFGFNTQAFTHQAQEQQNNIISAKDVGMMAQAFNELNLTSKKRYSKKLNTNVEVVLLGWLFGECTRSGSQYYCPYNGGFYSSKNTCEAVCLPRPE